MKTRVFSWVALVAALTACDSPLQTDPTASIDAGSALTTKRGVNLALNGAYRSTLTSALWARDELVYPDLYADNLDFTGTFQTDREVSLRNVTSANGDIREMWTSAYSGINRANNVLDAAPTVSDMTDADKAQTRGEALFIRALMYSELVRWFGGVPLLLKHSEGVDESANVARATQPEVYAQIEKDLEEAATLLPNARSNGRATQGAANALLARIYLDEGKNDKARDKATLVIGNTLYKLNPNYADNFRTKNSPESIFELQSTTNSTNSLAFWFFPSTLGGRFGFSPSLSLSNAFEAGDVRKPVTIGLAGATRYGNKYNRISTQDDNIPLLRLGEMYLIRAEANARLGAPDATVQADITAIRARAGLGGTIAVGKQALLDAILQERRVELAIEGQRFFDLRRFGVATTLLAIGDTKLLFPIPQSDRDVNPNLTQNPGY